MKRLQDITKLPLRENLPKELLKLTKDIADDLSEDKVDKKSDAEGKYGQTPLTLDCESKRKMKLTPLVIMCLRFHP